MVDQQQLTVPAWAVPPGQEIRGAWQHAAGLPGDRADGICAALLLAGDWAAADIEPKSADAFAARNANAYRAGLAETIAWLLGCAPPPLAVPRRNPDGSLVTADQLYAEMARGHATWGPEERYAARNEADRQYARAVRLIGPA